jgi:hypothetical protein
LLLQDQTPVRLKLDTLYPADEHVQITVEPDRPKEFSVKLRIPAWCQDAKVSVNGKELATEHQSDGYMQIQRTWNKADRIDLTLKLEPSVVIGIHRNEGKIAVMYGPLVLGADGGLLGTNDQSPASLPLGAIAAAGPTLTELNLRTEPAAGQVKTWDGARVFRINAVTRRPVGSLAAGSPVTATLVPFADAGGTGSDYKVWLPLRTTQATGNLLLEGTEARSRWGNVGGSINDDDFHSAVVTFDAKPADEDWFSVKLSQPETIGRPPSQMAGQSRDVLNPFPQPREQNWKHIDPIPQILAKRRGFYHRGQIAVRGGDNPHVDADRLLAADSLDEAVL